MGSKLLRQMRKIVTTISPDLSNRIMYLALVKKPLRLKDPQTFNEKLNYLKLKVFPQDPLVIRCADKVAVRDYLAEKGLERYLPRSYGVWQRAEDIDWDALPEQFVLKCSHGCGYNIICRDKAKLDKAQTIKKLNGWLREDFWKVTCEPHYRTIPHRILCEEYLGDDPLDYKFFCFGGQPEVFYISQKEGGDFHSARLLLMDMEGRPTEYQRVDYARIEKTPALPQGFGEMKELAAKLAQDFPFVRVDLYNIDGRIWFSELTFTPSAGMIRLAPESGNRLLGSKLDLSQYRR